MVNYKIIKIFSHRLEVFFLIILVYIVGFFLLVVLKQGIAHPKIKTRHKISRDT